MGEPLESRVRSLEAQLADAVERLAEAERAHREKRRELEAVVVVLRADADAARREAVAAGQALETHCAGVAERLAQAESIQLDNQREMEARISEAYDAHAVSEGYLAQGRAALAAAQDELMEERTRLLEVLDALAEERTVLAAAQDELMEERTRLFEVLDNLAQERATHATALEELADLKRSRLLKVGRVLRRLAGRPVRT